MYKFYFSKYIITRFVHFLAYGFIDWIIIIIKEILYNTYSVLRSPRVTEWYITFLHRHGRTRDGSHYWWTVRRTRRRVHSRTSPGVEYRLKMRFSFSNNIAGPSRRRIICVRNTYIFSVSPCAVDVFYYDFFFLYHFSGRTTTYFIRYLCRCSCYELDFFFTWKAIRVCTSNMKILVRHECQTCMRLKYITFAGVVTNVM